MLPSDEIKEYSEFVQLTLIIETLLENFTLVEATKWNVHLQKWES
jgi:hypothetical protein